MIIPRPSRLKSISCSLSPLPPQASHQIVNTNIPPTPAVFSTLSSFIYYPALTRISTDLSVSLALVQLTITSYLIVAGVAPAFMGDMADRGGRRPVYVLMFALMVGANLGIAVVGSWGLSLIHI